MPGRVKTRLTPPLSPEEAAALACAALEDTLAAMAGSRLAERLVVALDGEPGGWLPAEFELIAQRGEGQAERLAAAFEDVGDPALLVAMDTPQVTPELLDAGLARLADGADAVLRPRDRRRLLDDRARAPRRARVRRRADEHAPHRRGAARAARRRSGS